MKKTVKRRNGKKSVKKNAKKRVSTRKNKQKGGMYLFLTGLIAFGYAITQTQKNLEVYPLSNNIVAIAKSVLTQNNLNSPYTDCITQNMERNGNYACENTEKMTNDDGDVNREFKDCVKEMIPQIRGHVKSGAILKKGDYVDRSASQCALEAIQIVATDNQNKKKQNCLNSLSREYINEDCFLDETVVSFEDERINNFKQIQNVNENIDFGTATIPGNKGPDAHTSSVTRFNINGKYFYVTITQRNGRWNGDWNGSDITPEKKEDIAESINLLLKEDYETIFGLVEIIYFSPKGNFIRILYKNGSVVTIPGLPSKIFTELQKSYSEIKPIFIDQGPYFKHPSIKNYGEQSDYSVLNNP